MSVPHVAVENVLEKNWLTIVNFHSTEMESAQSLPIVGSASGFPSESNLNSCHDPGATLRTYPGYCRRRLRRLLRCVQNARYSHSIVLGGFELMS